MARNKSHKNALPVKCKLKKDPGVPKLPDLKYKNAEKQKTHAANQSRRPNPDAEMAAEPTLSSLAAMASTSNALEDSWIDPSSSTGGSLRTKEQIKRHYVRQLHKVIDESDIVVLVLDARDPEGCRSRLVEEEVRRRESEGKRLVFVLNKIDLVPRENAEQWLRHLRHSAPTLPFRSATSNQRSNLSSSTAPVLLRLLKAYKPSSKSVTVGIVGFPNVGKSSLINSLKRSKACSVAAQPGHTKDLQSVQLERGIRVIDSPGVVFDDDTDAKSVQKSSILLRNVVKVEDVDDPIPVVEEILARTAQETIQKIYNVPQFSSTLEFLTMLALNSGRLLKGGTPDILSAARQILMDWNHQKIPYMSTPPVVHPSLMPTTMADSATVVPGAEATGQAQILTELSKPFELAGFFGAADAGAFGGESADQEMVDDGGFVPDPEEAPMAEDVVDDGTRISHIKVDGDPEPSVPRKRARSPTASVAGFSVMDSSAVLEAQNPAAGRMPKRFRKAKDLSAYETAAAAAHSSSLNRRSLKKDAKKARRTAARAMRVASSGAGGVLGGMEVEELQSTFMVGVE